MSDSFKTREDSPELARQCMILGDLKLCLQEGKIDLGRKIKFHIPPDCEEINKNDYEQSLSLLVERIKNRIKKDKSSIVLENLGGHFLLSVNSDQVSTLIAALDDFMVASDIDASRVPIFFRLNLLVSSV